MKARTSTMKLLTLLLVLVGAGIITYTAFVYINDQTDQPQTLAPVTPASNNQTASDQTSSNQEQSTNVDLSDLSELDQKMVKTEPSNQPSSNQNYFVVNNLNDIYNADTQTLNLYLSLHFENLTSLPKQCVITIVSSQEHVFTSNIPPSANNYGCSFKNLDLSEVGELSEASPWSFNISVASEEGLNLLSLDGQLTSALDFDNIFNVN